QPGHQIHDARGDQAGIRSGKPAVYQDAKKTRETQIMNHAKGALPNHSAQIKGYGDEKRKIRGNDADANPKRTIVRNERHKQLRDVERHKVVRQKIATCTNVNANASSERYSCASYVNARGTNLSNIFDETAKPHTVESHNNK